MAEEKQYSLKEFAKYNAVSVLGALQLINGTIYTREMLIDYYAATLKDLQTGAMERSCKEFDKNLRGK